MLGDSTSSFCTAELCLGEADDDFGEVGVLEMLADEELFKFRVSTVVFIVRDVVDCDGRDDDDDDDFEVVTIFSFLLQELLSILLRFYLSLTAA